MERNSNDWHGQRRKFQTFTETRIFRHVKIHEHVRWNRSFRGGKFPRKREEKEGRGEGGSETIRDPQNLAVETPPAPPGSNQSFHLPARSLSLPFFLLFFVSFDGLQRVAGEG